MMIFRLAPVALFALALWGCSTDPKVSAQNSLEKGNQQLALEKFPEAIIEFRRAVQADPRLGPARLQLAHAYASVGDGPNALREYARAAELMPENNDAQIKAGNFMLLANQFADAQGMGERLLARSPKSVEAQVLIANALAGLKDWESAVEAFEKAVEIVYECGVDRE